MVCTDAVPARERRLETTTQARSVNRCDDGRSKLLEFVEQLLSQAAHTLGVRRRFDLEKLLDVGAGDEAVRFTGDQYHRLDTTVVVDSPEKTLEFADERG